MENDAAEDGLDANGPARVTPYELVFGVEAFEEERFPGMLAETEARDLAPDSAERFLLLGTAGKLLQELLPADAPPEAVDEHGALLFHGFQFWRFGKRLYLLAESLARRLAAEPPGDDDAVIAPPHPSGYLQLPRHLFWARVAEDARPEPVDGFFWVSVGENDPAEPPYGRLDVLLALGLRAGRPGFSVIDVGEELDGEVPRRWLKPDARPDAPDFGNVLPGGERDELHALVTAAEVLKLVALCFRYMGTHPDAVGQPERSEPPAEPSSHALPPSALPYRPIHLVEEGPPNG